MCLFFFLLCLNRNQNFCFLDFFAHWHILCLKYCFNIYSSICFQIDKEQCSCLKPNMRFLLTLIISPVSQILPQEQLIIKPICCQLFAPHCAMKQPPLYLFYILHFLNLLNAVDSPRILLERTDGRGRAPYLSSSMLYVN